MGAHPDAERRAQAWLAAFLELGVDPGQVSMETLRRIRIIATATLALVGFALIGVVQYALFGVYEGASALGLAAVLAIANLALLRHTRRPGLAAHLGLGVFAVMLVAATAVGGGFHDPGYGWLFLLPVGAAAATDPRGALVWLGVSLAILFGFFGLDGMGVVFENRIPEPLRAGQALFDRVTATLGLAAIAVSFVAAQRRGEGDLELTNEELRGEAGFVRLLMHGAVAANQALSLEEALRDSLSGVCGAMGWAGGHVYLVNEEGVLEASDIVVGDVDLLGPLVALTRQKTYRPGEGLTGQVLETGRPACLRDLRTGSGARSHAARQLGLTAAILTPVPVNGKVRAVIEFVSREPLPPGDRVLEVLELLGIQLGRVAEREVLHDRLRQSQKIEAIGQLAAGLAHEINNPMAYVRTNLNLLRSEWDELSKELGADDQSAAAPRLAECADLLDECAEGVDRTIAIVRDVKEFSHAGNASWEWVELNEVLDGALRVASPQLGRGVRIHCAFGEAPRVRGSSNQLRQVFLNLLVNAMQAVREDGTIRLETETAGEVAVVRVQDDGPGIRDDAMERLFEPFFTTKPVGEGTGLGLYVSYEIIRNHGGEIRVRSAPGAGATFEVRLPIDVS